MCAYIRAASVAITEATAINVGRGLLNINALNPYSNPFLAKSIWGRSFPILSSQRRLAVRRGRSFRKHRLSGETQETNRRRCAISALHSPSTVTASFTQVHT